MQATAGSSEGTFEVARLKEALRDPRERVLGQLERYQKDAQWTLPGNLSEKVAPHLLLQIFSVYPSAAAMGNRWIQDKQLERNHVAHEMLLMCMVLDKSLLEDPNYANTESCEIICRRVYALKKAFEAVRTANDWRQPKGAQASKWKSKVRWDLANEIDMRALCAETESLPAVDRELQGRLKERALLSKYVDNSQTATVTEDD